jgi:hypothetical protein
MNSWENVKLDYTFKIPDTSKFLNSSVNLLIQSGLTPIINAGTVWFNPVVNQIYEVANNVWSIVSPIHLQISKIVEEVRSIAGLTPEELLGKVTGLESFSLDLANNSDIIKQMISKEVGVFINENPTSIIAKVGDLIINNTGDIVSVKRFANNMWTNVTNAKDIYNQYLALENTNSKSTTYTDEPSIAKNGDQLISTDGSVKLYKDNQWLDMKIDVGNITGEVLSKDLKTGSISIEGVSNTISVGDTIIKDTDGITTNKIICDNVKVGNTVITEQDGITTNKVICDNVKVGNIETDDTKSTLVQTESIILKFTYPLPQTTTIDSIFLTKNALNKICLMRYNGSAYEEL